MKRKRKYFYVFLLPSFAGIALFVILPFADVVKRSFTTAVTGQFNGIKNYQTIFHNQAFLLAVENTLKFTFVCIPFLVLAGFFTALLLDCKISLFISPCNAYGYHCNGMENDIL